MPENLVRQSTTWGHSWYVFTYSYKAHLLLCGDVVVNEGHPLHPTFSTNTSYPGEDNFDYFFFAYIFSNFAHKLALIVVLQIYRPSLHRDESATAWSSTGDQIENSQSFHEKAFLQVEEHKNTNYGKSHWAETPARCSSAALAKKHHLCWTLQINEDHLLS